MINRIRSLTLAAACSLALVGVINLNATGSVIVRDGGMTIFVEDKDADSVLDELKLSNPVLDELKLSNPVLSADFNF